MIIKINFNKIQLRFSNQQFVDKTNKSLINSFFSKEFPYDIIFMSKFIDKSFNSILDYKIFNIIVI